MQRLGLVVLLAASVGSAQESSDFRPASSNVPGAEYPRVDAAGRVEIRIEAPEATAVRLSFWSGPKLDMEKRPDGSFAATTEPLDPGFHYYTLFVDGAEVSDPGSRAFFGGGRHASAVEIPEPGVDFFAVEDVPHGDVRAKRYFSKVTGSWRRLLVYTPPGYDREPERTYPVLYIQHGGGEDETGWATQGRADAILDNLIAAGQAKPMLVVMADGNLPAPGGARGYSDAAVDVFARELLEAIVPFVEAEYRVRDDAAGRALAGLSMGGGQTFLVGLRNKDRFGALGVFSTGLFGGIGRRPAGGPAIPPFDAEERVPGLLSDADSFNDALRVLYVSVGEQDPRFEATKKVVSELRSHGLNVELASFPGEHEWQVWRKSLHGFAQRIFTERTGIAEKRPVFGGACRVCPWGTMAEVVQAAMRPYGYDVQVCYNCNRADAPRIVSEARTPPPYEPDPAVPEVLAPRNAPGLGPVDFGATAIQFLRDAYRGKGFYAGEKPRTNLRLIANIQDPTYVLVAARAETGITDLSQVRQKVWPVRILEAGIGSDSSRILAYYGLSKEVVEAAGGRVGRSHEDREAFDVVIGGGGGMSTAPEWSIWTEISQEQDLRFIELPDDLLAELAREGEQQRGTIPVGLYPGVTRPIPTVVRTGTVVYGRDDLPDAFAYDVAKALDEQQHLLQWRHLSFSYNVHAVWKGYEVPLHPGAARYYRERGYMK